MNGPTVTRSNFGLPLLIASACLVLAGCGERSEADSLAAARARIEKRDDKAALIELRNTLQEYPESPEGRYLLGTVFLKTGDVAGALVELERARQLKYDENKVLPAVAEAMLAGGQAKKMTDAYGSVKLTDPKAESDLKTTVATGLLEQGQASAATGMVEVALKLNPRQFTARLLEARLVAGRGQATQAMALADKLVADEPDRAAAWQLKGELLWILGGDPAGATQAFRKALAIDGRHLAAHSALLNLMLQQQDEKAFKAQVAELAKAWPKFPTTQFYETQLALIEKDLKRAKLGAQELLRLSPENVSVLQLAGTIDLHSGDIASAEKHFSRAMQLQPESLLARRQLAETQLRAGRPALALNALQPLLAQPKPDAGILALAGEAHLQSGDTKAAEEHYARAVKASPGDVKIGTALAVTQLAEGKAGPALAQLESLSGVDNTTIADLALISARLRNQEPDQALKAVDRLEAKLPGKPLPHLLRGRALFAKKDIAGARASFEKALAIDAGFAPAVAGLASLDAAENKPADALKRFEALLAREPANVFAVLGLADLRRQLGTNPHEIATLLLDAIKRNPVDPSLRLALVEHYLSRNNASVALDAARSAAAAIPNNLQVAEALGKAQLASGEAEQALATFRKITAAAPSAPQAYLRQADAHMMRRDHAAASRSLKQALEVRPDYLPAHRGLVRIALQNKRVNEALAVARNVQKLPGQEAAGHVMEGEIHAKQRAWVPAAAAFRAALARDESTGMAVRVHALYVTAGRAADADAFSASWLRDHPKDADFLFHLGSIAMERKDFAVAESRYREVMALQPNNAATVNNIAWLMTHQGKPGALALAEQANRLLPNAPHILDTLASAQAAEKQLQKAVESQKRAVELEPSRPAYRLHLAKLLLESGDRAGGRKELERLAALGDKFSGQAEVAKLLQSP